MTLPTCDRIIELSEKATPGPWSHYQMTQDRGHFRYLQSEGSAVGVINTWPNPQPLADADFIAESRTLAPKIALALNEAVRAIEAAERREKNEYLGWSYAGGVNDCEHGYGEGIPCPKCDAVTVLNALARITELLK